MGVVFQECRQAGQGTARSEVVQAEQCEVMVLPVQLVTRLLGVTGWEDWLEDWLGEAPTLM